MADISRRRFLQIAGGAALGTIAAQVALSRWQPAEASGKSVSRTTGKLRRAVPSVCLQCSAHCGILGFLEDGVLRKIEGNPQDPNSRGKLCAKGLAGLNHAYSPDRLLYPIKRVGARGEGKWKRITWADAMEELSNRLQAIRGQGRPEEFHFVNGLLEEGQSLIGRFLRGFGTPSVSNEMDLYQANKKMAQRIDWGVEAEVHHVGGTRLIVNFGANPYEFHPMYIPLAQRLKDAQRRGVKMVTIDPRLSNTAAQSAKWLSPNPGTDAVIALAIANVIVKTGRANTEFLARWTNYPQDKLAQYLQQYTPESAASISGVSTDDIIELALDVADSPSSVVISGDGLSQHANGVQNERAVALLSAITGNLENPGGTCLPRSYELAQPDPQPPAVTFQDRLSQLIQGVAPEPRVSMMFTYMANPVYSSPVPREMARVLRDERHVPFLVSMDSYLTETADLADMVLPAATYLESYSLQSPAAYDMVPFVNLMQPVIAAQGESRSGVDVFLELGQRLGGDVGKFTDFSSAEGYWSAVAGSIAGLAKDGGWEMLKTKGVWYDAAASPSFYSYKKQGFATPSGKFEVYSQEMEKRQQPALPTYSPLPKQDGSRLRLVTFQFNVHTYGKTAPCMWLSEIVHENPVWLHEETAANLGIRSGDRVRLSSGAGSIVSRARVTDTIRPGVLAIGSCVGHWASGKIAQAEKFESDNPNTRLLWWGEHGNGVHPHDVIPWTKDPMAGGQGWKDTLVSLSKE